jgi:hypothetical protein
MKLKIDVVDKNISRHEELMPGCHVKPKSTSDSSRMNSHQCPRIGA